MPLLFVCCAPAPDAPDPSPRSFAAAELALRRGDLAGLRDALGKGPGLSGHARELAGRLDPEAWLIAIGASSREHDLPAAVRAMQADDDHALADALGFSDQQLRATILGGGASVFSRRSDGRNYFESGPQPINLARGVKLPVLPPGGLALSVTLWGNQGERRYRLQYTEQQRGLVDLQAALELGRESIECTAPRHAEAATALPAGRLRALELAALGEKRWYGAELRLLLTDGTIERALLGRDERGWALADAGATTQGQRLENLRDERLKYMGRRAGDFERNSGRWPRGFHELSGKPRELVDPAAPEGRSGWADFDDRPAAGFELGDGDSYAVAALWAGPQGRRAVARDGTLSWLKP
ncbi:MAG: hypothetical protein H6840_08070 [Planctomycetes bacterium]|nr:hypothetical protein [Planctomycetota bacterium]